MGVPKKHYTHTENWEGKRCIGIHMTWDYNWKQVRVAMPGYAEKAPKECHIELPSKRQNLTHIYIKRI